MVSARFNPEERLGLALAVAAHVALIAALLLHPAAPPPPVPARMTVSLAQDVGVEAAAPRPAVPAAPAVAPSLGEPLPQAVAPPKPVPRKAEEPAAPAKPASAKSRSSKPAPAKFTETTVADPIGAISGAAASHAARTKTAATPPTKTAAKKVGGARIGKDFLAGLSTPDSNSRAVAAPAAPLTGAAKAALVDAIARQLKPHWSLPQGVDADKLVTVLSWDLNPDGGLAGAPVLVRQEGIDASNSPQAARHVELAKRAVLRAAPFSLPPQYYRIWRHCTFRFDGELAQ